MIMWIQYPYCLYWYIRRRLYLEYDKLNNLTKKNYLIIKKTDSKNVGVFNVEFALKLMIYRSLKSFICLKWILRICLQHCILSSTTFHSRPVPLIKKGHDRFTNVPFTPLTDQTWQVYDSYNCLCKILKTISWTTYN